MRKDLEQNPGVILFHPLRGVLVDGLQQQDKLETKKYFIYSWLQRGAAKVNFYKGTRTRFQVYLVVTRAL